MRRTVVLCAPAAALAMTVVLAPPAGATGPGGWNHVGVGASQTQASLDGPVYALNTENPGILYAGGSFTSAGGNSKAKRIARWNGSQWSSLGTTPLGDGAVFAIAYHAGKVYVGGTFHNAGGNPDADFLAVWNGSNWGTPCTSTVPGPAITASVQALQIIGNTLYVGGSFGNGAGIASADYLVACDLTTGAARSTASADGSMNGAVLALTTDSNGTLYAGGQFINLEQDPAADHIAVYYSGTWHAMGGSATAPAVDSFVRSLTAVGTDLYVGTDSVNVNGIAQADHVARWDGSAWSAVGSDTAGTDGWFSNPTSYTIDGLAHYGSVVIATGSFQNANGVATADGVAYFDGTRWRPIGSDGAGNGPWSGHGVTTAVSGGQVYVGGNFTSAGGDTRAGYLAAYGLRLPDAMIGGSTTGNFTGNNIYSPSGNGETRNVTIQRGTSEDVYVQIQNDGLVPASFSVTGLGARAGITPHYFVGAANITTAVSNGTYSTPSLAARSSMLLRLHIAVTHSAGAGATLMTVVRTQSGTPPDAVRAVVNATG